ncbi:MAG: protease inhibitor I42 family protein [Nitrospiraceae bacterium]
MTNRPGGAEHSAAEDEPGARRLTASIQTNFSIHLWEDRTRGEQWVPAYEPAAFVLVSDDFLRTASGNAVDSGRRTFEFKPVHAGTHRIVFEKRMGWKYTAEDRRVFQVIVSSDSNSSRLR